MGKGLIGVGGDLPQDVTGSPVTEESRKNSRSFFKEMFRKDGTSDDEEYYEKYGKYDDVSRDSGDSADTVNTKTCPRCGSDNIVRVLTSSMVLAVPELRKEVKERRAVLCGACCGTGSSRTFRCKDCKLQWDENMEEDIREARER